MAESKLLKLSVLIVSLQIFSCSSSGQLKPFKSDGCSMFPDRSLINNENWCDCCLEHDIAYWKGGTKEERDKADSTLKKCILEMTGDSTLAELMYTGVRLGGSPYFPTWYRWGYGWNFSRGYKPLTQAEKVLVGIELEKYMKYQNAKCDSTNQDIRTQ